LTAPAHRKERPAPDPGLVRFVEALARDCARKDHEAEQRADSDDKASDGH